MADQRRSDFCVVFTLILTISYHIALKLSIQVLKSCFKLPYQYQLHSLPDTKVKAAKDPGKNYINVRPPLAHHL